MDHREASEKSLDLVQRWIIATLCIVLGGAPTAALAAYSTRINGTDHGTAVGVLVMSGVVGFLTAGAVLIVHRRSLLSPLIVLGLIPAAIAAVAIF